MHQTTPRKYTTTHAPSRLRSHFALALVALAACEFAFAGLPALTGSAPTRAAAQTAGLSATSPAALSDTSRQTWQGSAVNDLVAGWTRWLLSIPLGVNPNSTTETGINCAINQSGQVWYLAAPGGGTYNRTCTLPSGKALMMPIASYLDDYPCPASFGFQPAPGQSLEDFLRADATSIMDGTTTYATLDNKPLRVKRVTTGVFSFTAAGSLSAFGDACLADSPQLGVNDGFFLFIDPPAPGTHTLQVSSTNRFFGTTTGTFTLVVKN